MKRAVRELKAESRHQRLLEDYLELQKEFVSRKKKMGSIKQKRDTLLEEVRFLRQRYKYLTKLHAAEVKPESGRYRNADIHDEPLMKERNVNIYEDHLEHEGEGKEEKVWEMLRIRKKPKKYLANDKKVGKKKISWQDQQIAQLHRWGNVVAGHEWKKRSH